MKAAPVAPVDSVASMAPPSPARVGTRDRLLAATERCLRQSGIRRTTMTEIAADAGVSRALLYQHFPDKASLVVAALARTDEAFWADAHLRVSAAEGLAAQVTEAVRLSRSREAGVLLLQLKDDEPETFAATVGSGLRQMMPAMAVFWHGYLEAARDRGEVRADLDVGRAAEWIMRLVLSLVTVPGDTVDADDPASVRAFLDAFLVPSLC
jgi:AcrR family transcriptional regulator